MNIKRLFSMAIVYVIGLIIVTHFLGVETKAFGPGFLCGFVASIVMEA